MSVKLRPQRSYDHRLKELVRASGDPSLAKELGIPASTVMGWLCSPPQQVVTLDVPSMKEQELQREVLILRRRIRKLLALLRLLVVLLRISGFTLANERVPGGKAKAALLRSIDLARQFLPLRTVLRVLRLSPARYHSWGSGKKACRLDDRSSCPRTSPHQLTLNEIETIREMVRSEQYRHVPTGTLAILAQRLGKVFASPSTWYTLIHRFGWRRPRLRVHPAKPKIGLRTTQPNQAWHIDTTVIRLLDGSKAFLHAVIDNFSRRVLSWRLADKFDPASTISVLLEAGQGGACSNELPTVVTDAGVENVNRNVDELIQSGVLRRVIALTELRFSNSMIEAWWRTLKHQWLYLNSLDSLSTLRRLVAFYVDEHNTRLPHSAFRGQTPDEMYYGRGDHVPQELDQKRNAARKARLDLNRRTYCAVCPQSRPERSLGNYEAGWLPPVSMTS